MDLGDFGEEGQVWRMKGWFGKIECEETAIDLVTGEDQDRLIIKL